MENYLDLLQSILQIAILLLTIAGESPIIGLLLAIAAVIAIATKGADLM